MIGIIPGILEQDFAEIERKIRLVEPYVHWVQIDFLDGSLFENSNYHESTSFKSLDSPVLMEAHLMVKNPVQYIEPLFAAGFQRFIGHMEGFSEEGDTVYDFIHGVKAFDAEVGLAIDLPTDTSVLLPHLESIDQVLIMTIHTGKSGQQFQEEALPKIETVRNAAPALHLEVDGGINSDTAPKAVKAGATRLAVTSAIFQSENIKAAIQNLQQSDN